MMNQKIILDLLKEMREDQKKQNDKLESHGQSLAKQDVCFEILQEDIKEIKKDLSKNTTDVAYHIKRTDQLEALHKDNSIKIELSEKRITKLEEPEKAKDWLKKNYLATTSIIITILSIASVISKIKGLW